VLAPNILTSADGPKAEEAGIFCGLVDRVEFGDLCGCSGHVQSQNKRGQQ
jgi:hypothetical protein